MVPRPRWSLLYAIPVAALAAGAVSHAAIATPPLRVAVDGCLVVGAVAATRRWVRANRAALDMLDWCDCAHRTIRVRVIEPGLADRAPQTRVVESSRPREAGVTLGV